jgi:hypothetical protein
MGRQIFKRTRHIIEEKKHLLCEFRILASHIQRNNLQNIKYTKHTTRILCPDGFPFLHSVKDVDKIQINPMELPKVIPSKGQHNVSWIAPDVISNRFIGERLCFFEGGDFLINDSFFIATLKDQKTKKLVLALLNSTLSLLILEQLGRKNLGGGVLCVYGPEFASHLIVRPDLFSKSNIEDLEKNYDHLSARKILSVFEEIKMADRRELDRIVCEALGLDENDQLEIYKAVVSLVKNRLEKAGSV